MVYERGRSDEYATSPLAHHLSLFKRYFKRRATFCCWLVFMGWMIRDVNLYNSKSFGFSHAHDTTSIPYPQNNRAPVHTRSTAVHTVTMNRLSSGAGSLCEPVQAYLSSKHINVKITKAQNLGEVTDLLARRPRRQGHHGERARDHIPELLAFVHAPNDDDADVAAQAADTDRPANDLDNDDITYDDDDSEEAEDGDTDDPDAEPIAVRDARFWDNFYAVRTGHG